MTPSTAIRRLRGRAPAVRRPCSGAPARRAALAGTAGMLAALAVILTAGCSSPGHPHSGDTPVASLPGHPGSTRAAGALTEQQSDRDMISFARCMRSHGVQMPDPFHRAGHSGLSVDIPPHTPATAAGYRACQHFIQPVVAAKQAGAQSRAARHLPALTRYAQCMRGHDISMLDPTPDGELNLGRVRGITSSFGRYSPQFRAADRACRHLLPPGVSDNGTGP